MSFSPPSSPHPTLKRRQTVPVRARGSSSPVLSAFLPPVTPSSPPPRLASSHGQFRQALLATRNNPLPAPSPLCLPSPALGSPAAASEGRGKGEFYWTRPWEVEDSLEASGEEAGRSEAEGGGGMSNESRKRWTFPSLPFPSLASLGRQLSLPTSFGDKQHTSFDEQTTKRPPLRPSYTAPPLPSASSTLSAILSSSPPVVPSPPSPPLFTGPPPVSTRRRKRPAPSRSSSLPSTTTSYPSTPTSTSTSSSSTHRRRRPAAVETPSPPPRPRLCTCSPDYEDEDTTDSEGERE